MSGRKFRAFLVHSARANQNLIGSVQEACLDAGWTPVSWRTFTNNADTSILVRIEDSIRACDAVLAILDEPSGDPAEQYSINLNALFEYGYARGAQVPVIPIVHAYLRGQVPSDVAGQLILFPDSGDNIRSAVASNLRRIGDKQVLLDEFKKSSDARRAGTVYTKALLDLWAPSRRNVLRRLIRVTREEGSSPDGVAEGVDALTRIETACTRFGATVEEMRSVPALCSAADDIVLEGREAIRAAGKRIFESNGPCLEAPRQAAQALVDLELHGAALSKSATSYLHNVAAIVGVATLVSLVVAGAAFLGVFVRGVLTSFQTGVGVFLVGAAGAVARVRMRSGGLIWSALLAPILSACVLSTLAIGLGVAPLGRLDRPYIPAATMTLAAVAWIGMQPSPHSRRWVTAMTILILCAIVLPAVGWAVGWLATSSQAESSSWAALGEAASEDARSIWPFVFGGAIAGTLALRCPAVTRRVVRLLRWRKGDRRRPRA